MLQNFVLSRYCRFLGILALLVAGVTWWLDLSEVVPACIFCRSQRTAIGFLGLLMLLPHYRYLTPMLTIAIASMGLHASCAHLLLHFKKMTFTWTYTGLATAALLIMSVQLIILIERGWKTHKNKL